MPALSHQIFICCNQRAPGHPRGCCDPEDSGALRAAIKVELARAGLTNTQVLATRAGCLNQCELGPTLVIYPQAIWYGGVQVSDARRIVEETIVGGRVIEKLRLPEEILNLRLCRNADGSLPSVPSGEAQP